MKPDPENTPKTTPAQGEGPSKPVEMVEIKGRVVDPDGKPVAGATVRVYRLADGGARTFPGPPLGADGRFSVLVPKPTVEESRGFQGRFPWLLADAPGYGIGWVDRALSADRPDEHVVTLVEDGPPIEGRVVDLEGRPVDRANVEVARIYFEPKGDFDGWIARGRKGALGTNLWPGLDNLNVGMEQILRIATMTDADGRFQLTGVGRDRVAELIVSRPGVATAEFHVMTRDEPDVALSSRSGFSLPPILVRSPKLQVALAPSKRVEGIVRDLDSGEPIIGLKINAGVFEERSLYRVSGVEATTDARGHYRLDGLPRASAYRLYFSTSPGLPYNRGTLKAPADSPGVDAVTFDFALKKGLMVRGTVTDKVNGRPIRGTVLYLPFADNQYIDEFPGLSPSFDMQFTRITEGGHYEIAALPGHGLLCVMDSENRYRAATNLEAIKGYDAEMKGFTTNPIIPASGYNAFVATDFDPKAGSPTVDLQVDSGRSATVRVVDPEGQPLSSTLVKGLGGRAWPIYEASPSDPFEVVGLDPSQARRVVVVHEGRKLVGEASLRGDETGPVTIKLRPWGAITGRIVDDEGRPRKRLSLQNGNDHGSMNAKLSSDDRGDLPGDGWHDRGLLIGDDGRFRVNGLVPGLKYSAYAVEDAMALGNVFEDVTAAPGEVKDLGDLRVRRSRP